MVRTFTSLILTLLLLSALASDVRAAPSAQDWTKVAAALGKSGVEMPGGIYRVGLPRSDLHVSLDGIVLKPTFALGSWLAFAPMEDKTVVMGDLVLTEGEIEPVMKKLADAGIDITGLHNHLLRARPLIFYMHIHGEGDAVALATSIRAALLLSKTPFSAVPAASAQMKPELDSAAIDKALGARGKIAGGVYQVSIPRSQAPTEAGMTLTPPLGVAEAINFQPLEKGKVAITGDFVLTAAEVNPVLRILRDSGIEVTALHNHMLGDEPRLFFMHFWAAGPLGLLLPGLQAALNATAVQHGNSG